MLAAIDSVKNGGLSGNRSADMHGVPRFTLKDRLSGRVIHGVQLGPLPYLSVDEEPIIFLNVRQWGMAKPGGMLDVLWSLT